MEEAWDGVSAPECQASLGVIVWGFQDPVFPLFPVCLCGFLTETVNHSGWHNVLENAFRVRREE